jgi:hypothetical protein
MDQKPNGISVMFSIHMPRSGTITVVMKSQKANPRPAPWKQIMQNCTISWLVWQDHPGVSLAVPMNSTALFAYSFIATIIAN